MFASSARNKAVTGENDASFLTLPERPMTVLKAAKARMAGERLALGAAYRSGQQVAERSTRTGKEEDLPLGLAAE